MPKKDPLPADRFKNESFRLWKEDVEIIDRWIAECGQDRTAYLRACIRLMSLATANMEFDDKVRLIAKLSTFEIDEELKKSLSGRLIGQQKACTISLRALREERSLSLQELAKLAGVSPNTIWAAETGRSKLNPKSYNKLCKALNVEAIK